MLGLFFLFRPKAHFVLVKIRDKNIDCYEER